MTAARAALAALGCLTACATRPVDAFVQAERSLQQRDLAAALQALDAVPVAHVRYPEARAAALDVERDMRRCHELMLEAMLKRAEWRDAEALAALQRVREIWPAMPGVTVLIAATEQRRRMFAESPAAPPASAVAWQPAPLLETAVVYSPLVGLQPSPLLSPSTEAADLLAGVLAPAPAQAALREPQPLQAPEAGPAEAVPLAREAQAPAEVLVPPVDGAVAAGLMAVEAKLGRGQLEAAVSDLLDLAQQFPAEIRVRQRLVRVLNQRALLRYGDGAVAKAIADWQRVLELDPDNANARRMLDAAISEGR